MNELDEKIKEANQAYFEMLTQDARKILDEIGVLLDGKPAMIGCVVAAILAKNMHKNHKETYEKVLGFITPNNSNSTLKEE